MATPIKVPGGLVDRLIATPEFIHRNRLSLTRTQDEIVAKMKESSKYLFNFVPEVLVDYLSRENAKEVAEWAPITTIEETAQDFLDYLNFGWEKALDQRGLSASRTLNKLGAWLWLMGRDDLVELIDDDNLYEPYGMPALIAVAEKMGVDVPRKCRKFVNL